MFPLSASHYAELVGIKDPAQRQDLANVMEELSDFTVLLSRHIVIRLETDAVLTQTIGPGRRLVEPLAIIGSGAGWAFGNRLDLRFKSPELGDVTERVRQGWHGGPDQFDRTKASVHRALERKLLAGPKDDEIEELERDGWDPQAFERIVEERARQEREQSLRLDAEPRWRRGRLRDLVSAREWMVDLSDGVNEALENRGVSLEDLNWSRDDARAFVGAMPSTDVAVTLKTAAHKNAEKTWTTNDVHDIDALALATPYCDVVVTEAYAHHILHVTGTPGRTGTLVLRTLANLEGYLC